MRAFFFGLAAVLSGSCSAAEPDLDLVRKHFESKYYTVKLGKVAAVDPTSELEIGQGTGHGHQLSWTRFVPLKDGVEVLRIVYGPAQEYRSKWPPDTVPVEVTSARMKTADYLTLLGDLVVIDSVEPTPNPKIPYISSTANFWVSVRLASGGKASLEAQWSGYNGSHAEIEYAKPHAAFNAASSAIESLKFTGRAPTQSERCWASTKFQRDWKTWDQQSYWWVRERTLVMIGHIGDESAVPALRDVMKGDAKDRQCYHSINAIVKLVKKDVREKPVEEMDVQMTREKVLELIKGIK